MIDKDGRIAYRHVGPLQPRDLERTILPLLEQLQMIRLLLLALLPLAGAGARPRPRPARCCRIAALEARARTLGKELRCLVCQNQSIDDSDADLARDLRQLVRERLVAGDSDEQVLDLRHPALRRLRPAQAAGEARHLAAVVRAGRGARCSAAALVLALFPRPRRRRRRAVAELDAGERERLDRLLAGDGGSGRS